MRSQIIYDVAVDWDAIDWAAEPDFSQEYDNISGDIDLDGINYIGWNRGKQKEEGNAPAATCEIRMRPGLCDKYSPFTTGVLAGKVRPWLPVRVRIFWDSVFIPCYFGYINKILIDPNPDLLGVAFYCTDGTDLLARQLVAQNPNSKSLMSDGAAIGKILDAAGWSATRRNIQIDGGDDLLGYPVITTY